VCAVEELFERTVAAFLALMSLATTLTTAEVTAATKVATAFDLYVLYAVRLQGVALATRLDAVGMLQRRDAGCCRWWLGWCRCSDRYAFTASIPLIVDEVLARVTNFVAGRLRDVSTILACLVVALIKWPSAALYTRRCNGYSCW